jgi:hypothetical protein
MGTLMLIREWTNFHNLSNHKDTLAIIWDDVNNVSNDTTPIFICNCRTYTNTKLHQDLNVNGCHRMWVLCGYCDISPEYREKCILMIYENDIIKEVTINLYPREYSEWSDITYQTVYNVVLGG